MSELRTKYTLQQLAEVGSAAASIPAEDLRVRSPGIDRAVEGLKALQASDGYWCFEFEADCSIPSEYVLMMHFMDEIDETLEQKIGVYIRAHQDENGGWPLYPGGEMDISCSVKSYFALKLLGDDPTEAHMVRARDAILSRGGAACANVFTHIALALFEQMPWRGVPFIPVEIILLPRWFPFHISKVSYWSRAVMVPLFVLTTLKPKAANPRNTNIRELFVVPPEEERNYFPVRSWLNRTFLVLDAIGRIVEPLVPSFIRKRAIRTIEHWVIERLNGHDGLGAIFPAMVNAHEMLATLGYGPEHPYRQQTKKSLEDLLVIKDEHAYCQPCMSPIWDTGLACLVLQEAGDAMDAPEITTALEWLQARQLLDEFGDWRWQRPDLRGGGWAFQFGNTHYPDIDDTPVVAWAMLNTKDDKYRESIERAAEWIVGMQSSNGGWGSFDVDNTHYYLNDIPFADHGALLDPPTSDVTGRCLTFLARLDREKYKDVIERGLAFLREEQELNGSWFGRWGTNYVYGTWSVLTAIEVAGSEAEEIMVRRATDWLKSVQREDGGWGEDNYSYFDPSAGGCGSTSTSFQTAWAVLGLIAGGEGDCGAVVRGIEFLEREQQPDGLWLDGDFTAPGFPRVFYLKYHGYSAYFPLWALVRYRNLRERS